MGKDNGFLKNVLLVAIVTVIVAGLTFLISWQVYSQKMETAANVYNQNLAALQTEKVGLQAEKAEMQNQINNKQDIIKMFLDYEEYSIDYYKEIDALSKSYAKINETLDYTSCIASNNNIKEQHQLFNEQDLRNEEFFRNLLKYINTTKCSDKIEAYEEMHEETAEIRKKYTDENANWCYGYHKVDWSDTWDEEYFTPIDQAYNRLSEQEDILIDGQFDVIDACLLELKE